MSAQLERPRFRAGRGSIVFVALAMLSVLLLMPTASTSAQFQASLPATAGSAGTGSWCISPDPATTPGAIRLSDAPVVTSSPTTRMVIVPVANNSSWNAAGGQKNLAARVWGCQDTTSAAIVNDSLRVMAWSNPATGTTRGWASGSDATLDPTSRLNPNSTGMGAQLVGLSTAATVDATTALLLPITSGDLRRYSWMVAGNRSSAAPTNDPAQCTWAANLLGAICTVSTTAVGFASSFNTSPWAGQTATPITYPAHTIAAPQWGATNSWLNGACGVLGLLLCNSVPINTFMTATTATPGSLYTNLNGNLMQWVVVLWTGTTAPPADLVVEIVLQ